MNISRKKYYSEKLYSTGNDNLDSLLEKAFYDGYRCAQREFSEEDKEEKKYIAREILDAEEEGDMQRVRELKKKFVKRDRKMGKGLGALAGAVGGGLLAGQAKHAGPVGVIAGAGGGALLGRAIGGGIGRRVSNNKYENYRFNASREKEEQKKKNNK